MLEKEATYFQVFHEVTRAVLSVPMVIRGRVIGVLRIYTAQPRRFSQNEMDLISAIAEIGGIAIENARIFEARGAELSKVLKGFFPVLRR